MSLIAYLACLFVFIIGFACMFNLNLELFGITITLFGQLFLAIILFIDRTQFSPSLAMDLGIIQIPFLWTLVLGMLLQFIANILMNITMWSLQSHYSAKGTPIKLSKTHRRNVSLYSALFFMTSILIALSLLWLSNSSDTTIIKTPINITMIIFSAAILAFTSSEIYIANNFSTLIGRVTSG